MNDGAETGSTADRPSDPGPPSLPQVPGPLGRKVLLFEFLVLAEYWVAPLFLGVTNYAGLWSDIGVALFGVFTASLVGFVLWPLRPHLRAAFAERRWHRWLFHGVWSTTLVVGLFAINILQFTDGPGAPWVQFSPSTVYTPFGAWPTLDVYLPALQLWSTWNLEAPAILLLLGWSSAASVVLGPARRPPSCPVPARAATGWRGRLAAVGAVLPLGLISGCPGCAPVYFAALAMAAPGAAYSASASIPLVPWIGFAGLLYLLGFGLALWLIHRATADPAAPSPDLAADG